MHQQKYKLKSLLCLFVLVVSAVLVLLSSCGLRSDSEPALDTGESSAVPPDRGEDSAVSSLEEPEGALVPVAEFYYRKLPCDLDNLYAFNQEWLYFYYETWEEGRGFDSCVCQARISGQGESREFLSCRERENVQLCALLADREGNCFTFWKEWEDGAQGAVFRFFMEKYSPEGIVQWHTEYTPEELGNSGEQLRQGTVAQDGRICLYTQGAGGSVFFFGKDGTLESVCSPELESLDGIAAGPGENVYGYCAAGSATSFARLGDGEEVYVCPMVPAQVFDGREEGVYLSDGKSLWSYLPESARLEKVLDWGDEHVQIGASVQSAGTYTERTPIAGLYKSENTITVLCLEQRREALMRQPVLTFASVVFRDRKEYPERRTVTVGVPLPLDLLGDSSSLEYLVRRYNRQSRTYRVEISDSESSSVLSLKILRGEGPDLIHMNLITDKGSLAAEGVLEDLTEYYAAGQKVKSGDIFPSVRRAGTIMGKNVLVIPAFSVSSMTGEKKLVEPEDWTVWNFLAMGQENRMFCIQSPLDAFRYCMGIQKGEHFIDYEKRECHFDSPEFRRILEECLAWKTYDGNAPGDTMPIVINGENVGYRSMPLEEASWLFEPNSRVCNGWGEYLFYDKDYLRKKVGYPGWEGLNTSWGQMIYLP